MANDNRKVTIFAGIITLVQGVLWSLVAVLFITIHDCLISEPLGLADRQVNVYTLLYASYINGSSCSGSPQFYGISDPVPSTVRTYYWMLLYALLSAIWIPVSVLLIVSGVSKVKGRQVSCYYIPWILNSVVIAVADAVAIVFYAMDLSNTTTTDDYVKFLGGEGSFEQMTGSSSENQDTTSPAVFMILYFSRCVMFWVLNVALIFHSFCESRRLRKFNLQAPISNIDYVENDERYKTWTRPPLNYQPAMMLPRESKQEKPVFTQPNEPAASRARKAAPLEVNINEKRNIIHESDLVQNVYIEGGQVGNTGRSDQQTVYKTDEFGIPIEEIRIPRAANSSYPESVDSTDTPIPSPVFDYLGRPARLSSICCESDQEQLSRLEDGGKRHNNSQSQELLRNQAPWSYLHPRTPPPVEATRLPPAIPVPDYTLHPHHRRSTTRPPILQKPPFNSRRVHGLQ